MSLEFTLVRRAISLAVIDGPDTDDNPDILQAQGSVLFEPVIKKGDSIQVQTRGGSETYALAPIECPINDGIISHRGQDGVKLPAGGAAANPSLIRWKATFSRMQAGGKSFTLAPVVFDAVPGGEIDLTMVAPVAGAPEGVVRGPRGTSLESIIVDGSELVFTAVDDAGSFEIARIPLDEMVRAEAEAAADGVRDALAVDVAASQSARDAAEGHASRAATSESNAAASETNAKQSETNAGDYAAVATTAATEAVDAMEESALSRDSAEISRTKAEQAESNASIDAARAASYARNSPISITDYGAVPDGETDCTQAFNDACDDARLRKAPVYIPAGRWKVAGTVDISGVHIFGEISGYQSAYGSVIVGGGENTAFKQSSFTLTDLTMSVKGLRFESVGTGLDLGYMVQTVVEDVWIYASSTGIKFGSNDAVGPLWCIFSRVVSISTGGHGMVMQGNQWCNANEFHTCEFKGAAGFAGVEIDTQRGHGAVKNSFKNCEFAGDGAGILLTGTTRSTTIQDCYMESKGPAIVSRGLAIDLHMNANVYGSTGNDSGFGSRFIDHQSGSLTVIVNGGWIVTGTDERQSGVVFVGSDSVSTLSLTYLKKPHASASNQGFVLNAPELTPEFQSVTVPENSRIRIQRSGDFVRFFSTASVSSDFFTSWVLPAWARPSATVGARPVNSDGEIYLGSDGKFTLVGLAGKSFRFDITFLV